jgi:hypothetical protein
MRWIWRTIYGREMGKAYPVSVGENEDKRQSETFGCAYENIKIPYKIGVEDVEWAGSG